MSRVVKVNNPGKIRSQHMRTAAEMLHRLGSKPGLDDEVRDIVALLVFCFREIDSGIDESALAWEKRDYWVKAEKFRARWAWAGGAAAELENLLREERWEELPMLMVKLLPRFEDIKVSKLTRSPSIWRGAYRKLLEESSG